MEMTLVRMEKVLLVFVVCLVITTKAGVLRLSTPNKEIHMDSMDGPLSDMAETLNMSMPIGDTVATMRLTRSHVVPEDTPILLGTAEHAFSLWQDDEKCEFVIYGNQENNASFVLWKEGILGTFSYGHDAYTIEPMDSRMSSRQAMYYDEQDEQQYSMVTFNGADFVLRRIDSSDMAAYDDHQPISIETKYLQEGLDNIMGNKPNRPDVNGEQSSYEVELLVLIDFSIFQKWTQRSRSFEYNTREVEALSSIRLYYANVINGMNQRISQMADLGRSISIHPVAMYIAKSASASFWTEMAPVKQGHHCNPEMAFAELTKWLGKERDRLPAFDEAILFTDNFLRYEGSDGDSQNIAGFTNIMGICDNKRAALCRDSGLFGCIKSGTEQLKKSMGIYQGNMNIACRKKSSNSIMVDQPKYSQECAKDALWYFLEYLSISKKNCLNGRSNYDTNWNESSSVMIYPGQRYTADEQCKSISGLFSFHCVDDTNVEDICQEMSCWQPYVAKCDASPGDGAADGTPCGMKSWCLDGQCINDPAAPEQTDTSCIYGDHKGIVDDNTGQRCYDIGLNTPHKCYDEIFRRKCCDTCSKVIRQDLASVGCEYGDRDTELCRKNFYPTDCYNPAMRSTCCETCQSYANGLAGCEYGDKSSDCGTITLSKSSCYEHNLTCCSSCPRLQVGVRGCEWGDRQIMCHERGRHRCYDAQFADNCCDYCRKVNDGPRGCAWGDKYSACKIEDCQDASMLDICCQTCRGYSTTSPRPASTTTPKTSTTTPIMKTSTTAPPTKTSTTPITKTSTTTPITKKTISTTSTPKPTFTSIITTTHTHRTKFPETMSPSTTSSSVTPSSTEIGTDHVLLPQNDYIPPASSTCDNDISRYCEEIHDARSHECYWRHEECCKTCKQYATGDPTCPFGDRGSCRNIREGRAHECSFRQEECCQSCKKYQTGDPSCPFGDTKSSCETIKSHQCYSEGKECCQTCKTHETGDPECPYGNRISWCSSYVAREGEGACDSMDLWDQCCQSCVPKKIVGLSVPTSTTAAPPENCTDDASWCATLFPGQCYKERTRDTCCATCHRAYTGNPKCLYGHHYTWCKNKDHCKTNKRGCCAPCNSDD